MYLKRLALTNYRVFRRLDIDMPRRILLLIGANAQGKTSLLEAIYLLSTFTSFHTSSDRQLINFHTQKDAQAVGRIVADIERSGSSHQLEIRLILENNGFSKYFRKEILVDGVKRNAHQAMGVFNTVTFLPQMTRIIEDGPDERRRFLNLLISQAVPGYARKLSEYKQALSQRNALLKMLSDRGGDLSQLEFWDETLAKCGAFLMFHRIQAIHELESLARSVHMDLTDSAEVLRMDYQPAYDPIGVPEGQYALPIDSPTHRDGFSESELFDGMIDALRKKQREEIARGVTTLGPHRDELRFLSNGVDLGDYGSRGQIRTALMSLKLAEVAWIKQKTGENPVLLLDEIMAELDVRRRADLLDVVDKCDQVLMTTTDIRLFGPELEEATQVWQVDDGRIIQP